ncbi:MAG TPA: NHL repeat-containing protein [Solirubrobacterales bacterium]
MLSAGSASAATRAFLGSFDGSATGVNPLAHPTGLVVDEMSSVGDGNVLLADGAPNERIDVFGPRGEAPQGVAAPYEVSHAFAFGGEAIGVAVDNSPTSASKGDLYVADIFSGVVDKFALNTVSEGYEYVCQLTGVGGGCTAVGGTPTEGFGEPTGVGVDSHGNVYVSSYTHEVIDEFGPAGEDIRQIKSSPGAQFQLGRPAQIAFDSSGDLYVQQFEGAKAVLEYPANLAGEVEPEGEPRQIDPGPASGVAVDSSSDRVYVLHQGHVEEYGPAGEDKGEFGAGVIGSGTGIGVNVADGSIYVSDAEKSEVEVFGPFPVTAPTTVSTSVSEVSADTADLRAEINPNSLASTYRFEYGVGECAAVPDPCSSVPVAPVGIGSGHEPVAVSQSIAGLAASTRYHYMVVAENSLGRTAGPERTFITQANGAGFTLSDGRGWELVSPADKHGAKLTLPSAAEGGISTAAAGGEALAYLSLGSIESFPEGNRALEPSQVLARHSGSGWTSKDITLPHTSATPISKGQGYEYRYFSPSLESAVVEPRDETLLSQQASARTLYLRENVTSPPGYKPLVTGKEGVANVPPGTNFSEPCLLQHYGCPLAFKGADGTLQHVVLQSAVPLVAGATPFSLYEWAGGQLAPVSILPEGEGGAVARGELGAGALGVRGAVSLDGSRVFWNPGTEGAPGSALYVRDGSVEETLRLDQVQPGASGSGGESPVFQGASADGSKVFFTDGQQLTTDANTGGADLYECELTVNAAAHLGCVLRDLTPNPASPSEGADVQGIVSAFGEAGNALYLVANGKLAPGARDGSCTDASRAGPEVRGEICNLYSLRRAGSGGWETHLVAVLEGVDRPDWGQELEHPGESFGGETEARYLSAAGSPDGRYLAFMSQGSPTGYDSRGSGSGLPAEEVYLYDSAADGGEGEVICVSCNPTGARPASVKDASDRKLPLLFDPLNLWEGHEVAAILPDPIQSDLNYVAGQPRAVLDNGRVFFNTVDALTPGDSNGVWDPYGYEPTGVGSCGTAGPTTATTAAEGGCVGLMSSGIGSEESAFLDASESGDDVFFFTAAKLTQEDTDTSYDVYDAHICGAGWQCPPPAIGQPSPCSSSGSCRTVPPVPAETVPGTSIASGSGNFKPKPHHHKKKKQKKPRRKKHKKPHSTQKRKDAARKSGGGK